MCLMRSMLDGIKRGWRDTPTLDTTLDNSIGSTHGSRLAGCSIGERGGD